MTETQAQTLPSPLDLLYSETDGEAVTLPERIRAFYGSLALPRISARPTVISNFVSTLDGVVTLGIPGMIGGDAISGNSIEDRAVMGLLRAVSDAVIFGAGNLRASPTHIWSPQRVFKPFANEYAEIRTALGLARRPLNVIITERGEIDFSLSIFSSPDVEILIVTGRRGGDVLAQSGVPSGVGVSVSTVDGPLTARWIVEEICRVRPAARLILHEGGPKMMAPFYRERLIDELFLTFSPQVAGRDGNLHRPGFLDGLALAPEIPTWGEIVSVHKGGDHLFFRYRFKQWAPENGKDE